MMSLSLSPYSVSSSVLPMITSSPSPPWNASVRSYPDAIAAAASLGRMMVSLPASASYWPPAM